MRASELREYDVVYLTPGESWVVTSDAQTEGVVAEFTARKKEGDGWGEDQKLRFPAAFHVGIIHAWRVVEAPCVLCKETYEHRMDVAVAMNPRGICGPCNARTTAMVLVDHHRST